MPWVVRALDKKGAAFLVLIEIGGYERGKSWNVVDIFGEVELRRIKEAVLEDVESD